jgi:hypothetical protein
MRNTWLGLAFGSIFFAMIAPSCSSKDTSLPLHDGGGSAPEDSGGTALDGHVDALPDSRAKCVPGEVKNFTPTWRPPSPFQAKCSAVQIHDLIACYFGAKDQPPNCSAISMAGANADCKGCLFTSSIVAGPLIVDGNTAHLNVAGCIATFDGDVSPQSCAAKYKAATDCALLACATTCPGDDAASVQARADCAKSSLESVCKTYATQAACSDDLLNGKAAPCATRDTFIESAMALGALFCGNGASDAGADAGD